MERMIKREVTICLLLVLIRLRPGVKQAGAQPPDEFFRGKTLQCYVGSSPGGPTDLFARMIAPFLAKEIDAKMVRVETMETNKVGTYVYAKGSQDGLTFLMETSDAIIGNDILKAPGARYEADKFNYIADVNTSVKVFQLSPKLTFRTIDALKKAKGLRGGGTSAKGSIAMSTASMLEILGLDGKVITGFNGKQTLTLAMARGEMDFMVTSDSTAAEDERDGYVINLMTTGDKRSVRIPNVPSLSERGVKVSKDMEAVHKFIAYGGMAAALPPGVPSERVEYLRKAYQSLSNNKDLQMEIKKLTGMFTPFVSGEEVQQEMAVIKADKQLAAKLNDIFKRNTAVH